MTQSKHTPAPWRISDNEKAPYLIYGSNNYAVADCKVYHNKTDIKADMSLIAAAPELLEALEAMAGLKQCRDDAERYRMAARAIAKARGEA